MGGYWSYYQIRRVQCPICSHSFKSQIREPQCSKCKQRFLGDDNLFKTEQDRTKERVEIDKTLGEAEASLKATLTKIESIRQKQKPIDFRLATLKN